MAPISDALRIFADLSCTLCGKKGHWPYLIFDSGDENITFRPGDFAAIVVSERDLLFPDYDLVKRMAKHDVFCPHCFRTAATADLNTQEPLFDKPYRNSVIKPLVTQRFLQERTQDVHDAIDRLSDSLGKDCFFAKSVLAGSGNASRIIISTPVSLGSDVNALFDFRVHFHNPIPRREVFGISSTGSFSIQCPEKNICLSSKTIHDVHMDSSSRILFMQIIGKAMETLAQDLTHLAYID